MRKHEQHSTDFHILLSTAIQEQVRMAGLLPSTVGSANKKARPKSQACEINTSIALTMTIIADKRQLIARLKSVTRN